MRKVLFLGCNDAQLPYLKQLKNEFYVIGTDLNDSAPGRELCDKFYNIGYMEVLDLINICEKEGLGSNDFVFTASEQFAYTGVSTVSKYLNLAAIVPSTVDLILNKQLFYEYFEQNGIPYPKTKFIANASQLSDVRQKLDIDKSYYLKSDCSKNPKYIYFFHGRQLELRSVNWHNDRFLKNGYVLQEEFKGDYYRVNFIEQKMYLFTFEGERMSSDSEAIIDGIGIKANLLRLNQLLNLGSMITKYDVIVNNNEYVVLDIGIDHPGRLAKYFNNLGYPFSKYYVEHYLHNRYLYPDV